MYVGVPSMIAGWALLFGAWSIAAYGAAVWAGFMLFVLGYEEPH
jgi:protein-S-isoprenylcysteine O-methyltransferase Ste14